MDVRRIRSRVSPALPLNSVGGPQLKNNSVGAAEIKAGAVRTSEVKNFSLLLSDFQRGQVVTTSTALDSSNSRQLVVACRRQEGDRRGRAGLG